MTNRYREITKGVPAHIVARALNSFTPGRDWTGMCKRDMEDGYDQLMLEAIDSEARGDQFGARLKAEVLLATTRKARREAERRAQAARAGQCASVVARLKELGVVCSNDGNGRVSMSVAQAESLVRLIERLLEEGW
jgi:hypothetical protein